MNDDNTPNTPQMITTKVKSGISDKNRAVKYMTSNTRQLYRNAVMYVVKYRPNKEIIPKFDCPDFVEKLKYVQLIRDTVKSPLTVLGRQNIPVLNQNIMHFHHTLFLSDHKSFNLSLEQVRADHRNSDLFLEHVTLQKETITYMFNLCRDLWMQGNLQSVLDALRSAEHTQNFANLPPIPLVTMVNLKHKCFTAALIIGRDKEGKRWIVVSLPESIEQVETYLISTKSKQLLLYDAELIFGTPELYKKAAARTQKARESEVESLINLDSTCLMVRNYYEQNPRLMPINRLSPNYSRRLSHDQNSATLVYDIFNGEVLKTWPVLFIPIPERRGISSTVNELKERYNEHRAQNNTDMIQKYKSVLDRLQVIFLSIKGHSPYEMEVINLPLYWFKQKCNAEYVLFAVTVIKPADADTDKAWILRITNQTQYDLKERMVRYDQIADRKTYQLVPEQYKMCLLAQPDIMVMEPNWKSPVRAKLISRDQTKSGEHLCSFYSGYHGVFVFHYPARRVMPIEEYDQKMDDQA